MRVLFLHDAFPGQYRYLAAALARSPDHRVVFASRQRDGGGLPGLRRLVYTPARAPRGSTHPYLRAPEAAVLSGQAAYRACAALKRAGFVPDVVCAHAGFGPALFIKDLFPDTRLIGFFEWYYRAQGSDADYLEPGPLDADAAARIHLRNATILLELARCDAAICPTAFQRAQFPAPFRERLIELHDGIDADFFTPGAGRLPAGLPIPDHAPVVTYATRGLEPYRGFPHFIEAAARVLAARPEVHVVVVGADEVHYSRRAESGSYKEEALGRLSPAERARLHFTGALAPEALRDLWRRAAVHVYLTVPFVLSWSLLEAMATGCLIVAADTPPVREVARDGTEALLVDFRDPARLAGRILDALALPDGGAALRRQARARILRDYDIARLLPRQIGILHGSENEDESNMNLPNMESSSGMSKQRLAKKLSIR